MKVFKLLAVVACVVLLYFVIALFFSGKVLASLSKNDTHISLEVAKTEKSREYGLMNRESMPQDHGMLFLFPKEERLKFWMKNTLIPLDMIFLKNNEVLAVIKNVPPCGKEINNCPSYGPDIKANAVIELNAGMAEKLSIHNGDLLRIEM